MIMRILFIIATFAFVGCGHSPQGNGAAQPVKTTGQGKFSLKSFDADKPRTEDAMLAKQSPKGQVSCTRTAKDELIVSAGKFASAKGLTNDSMPKHGLTAQFPAISKGEKKKLSSITYFNLDSSDHITQPSCVLFTPGPAKGQLQGLLQCTDDTQRPGWGMVVASLQFSCPL